MAELSIESEVAADLAKVREIISKPQICQGAGIGSLYIFVAEKLSGMPRNTHAQLDCFEAYETALSVFRAGATAIRKEANVLTLEQKLRAFEQTISARAADAAGCRDESARNAAALQAEISNIIFFSNRYALHFAGNVGLALLKSGQADVKSMFSFGYANDSLKDNEGLTKILASTAAADFMRMVSEKKGAINDEELKSVLECIFTSWVKQFSWDAFSDITGRFHLAEMKLKFGKYSMAAGAFSEKHDEVIVEGDFIHDARRELVIGSQELGRVLWSNFIKLSAYDHARRRNPYDPASVVFVYGEPGGGKTFTAHANIQSFAELCKSKGIPLWAFTHSTTDYASHYQNLTANQLALLGGRIRDFPGIVIMYVADADTLFQSRKDPRLTAEQQNTLSVYMKMFDGTMIPKTGKFMAIMDANYIEGIDDATKSRVFEEIVELKRFDKREDFARLAKSVICKGGFTAPISEDDWKAVGDYILKGALSNREITHVLKKLRRGFEVPEDMIGKQFEQHEAYRNQQMQGITKEAVTQTLEKYIQTRMAIERASEEARRADSMERFLSYLTTEAAKPGAAKNEPA